MRRSNGHFGTRVGQLVLCVSLGFAAVACGGGDSDTDATSVDPDMMDTAPVDAGMDPSAPLGGSGANVAGSANAVDAGIAGAGPGNGGAPAVVDAGVGGAGGLGAPDAGMVGGMETAGMGRATTGGMAMGGTAGGTTGVPGRDDVDFGGGEIFQLPPAEMPGAPTLLFDFEAPQAGGIANQLASKPQT